jgi:WD40 repeat protein
LAVLLKIESGDLLTIHEPGTYEVISKASIPTVDAQGLKWSPNGAWLAVWDAASAGTTVAIYTADGQHFRTYSAEAPETDFGVRTVEWSHDSSLLAIGKHDGTVDLINGTTVCLLAVVPPVKLVLTALKFTLRHVLGDPTTFRPIGRDVYVERTAGGSGTREYVLAPESPVFPYTYKTPSGSRAVSSISFNPSNSFVATIDQALPHIVWQWAITGETKPRLVGALVQRSSIQQLLWNPELPELLMTTTDESFAFVHQWICGSVPRAVAVQWSGGKFSTSWIKSSEASSGLIWVGCPSGYAMGYLTGSGSSTKFSRIACLEDRYVPLEPYDFPPTQ